MTGYITGLPAASALLGDELIEVSQRSTSVAITATTISAAASDNSYNDSANGFVTAGFEVGDRVNVAGFTGDTANNILVGVVTAVTAGKLTIGGTDGDVIVDDAAGESVTISRWESRRLEVSDIGGSKRGFSFAILGTAPTADEPLAAWTPPSGEIVTFADDFVGCVGKKIGGGTNPASSYSLVVKKNGSDVGTITISTGGVVSFATTGTTVELIGGTDTLTIYGATTPDAAVGYAFTMAGDL